MNILYEDNHLLVVEKPVNIPVQADSSHDSDLLSELKQYLKEKYNKPGNVYLGLIHRLDRPVGGVMVFARTSKAAERLSRQVQKHEIEKYYLAVVQGKLTEEDGIMEDYLVKDGRTNMVTVTTKEKGKPARLDYHLLGYTDNLSLVKIRLITGRSHQIRVQFSSRSHPLWGDQRYNLSAKPGQQIALWSCQLSFNHPVSGERLTFTSNPPARYPFDLF